ncbi:MAG: ABC transporter substrate-binding protein [Thermohalobaculum sp.]|nr:ABC transporter substrate-binding protein [Thermohalobaculum sp.]
MTEFSRISRRGTFLATSALAALLASACTGALNETTLRAVPHADLVSIDPIETTAYITRSHGYLVYDTLFAYDQAFQPQPQMVDTWSSSTDGLTWTFRLRDGLEWHDGKPVTAADVVASLTRWGKRDGLGQTLFARVASLTADDAQSLTMVLSTPYPDVLDALAKMSSNVPFIMPAAVAATDPFTEIADPTGSGPFMLDTAATKPGERVVYVRNPDYVPRAEPTSLAAGAKVAKVDRIEWLHYPNQEAAVDALLKGEVDYLESPSTRLAAKLKDQPGVTVAFTDPLGNVGMAVFNHKVPPFDQASVRRAVLMAIDQEAYMTAALGDPVFWRTCYSIYPCDTEYATEAGSEIMQTASLDAARKALKRSSYEGTPVVILKPVDNPVLAAFTDVTAERLAAIGMTVEVEEMTWAELIDRRDRKYPDGDTRWSMFHTWWIAADLMDPSRVAFSGQPATGWIGWPLSPEVETLRNSFASSTDAAERQAIAAKIQEQIYKNATFGILGQFYEPIAFRNTVTGLQSPIQMYYNLGLAD